MCFFPWDGWGGLRGCTFLLGLIFENKLSFKRHPNYEPFSSLQSCWEVRNLRHAAQLRGAHMLRRKARDLAHPCSCYTRKSGKKNKENKGKWIPHSLPPILHSVAHYPIACPRSSHARFLGNPPMGAVLLPFFICTRILCQWFGGITAKTNVLFIAHG